MEAEFMSDALDDLHAYYAETTPVAPYVAPIPAGFFPVYVRQREAMAMAMDVGFLLAVHEAAQAAATSRECLAARKVDCSQVVSDLVAWRVGGLSVAQHHATGRPATVAADQHAAARNRKHREYRDGLRARPLREAV